MKPSPIALLAVAAFSACDTREPLPSPATGLRVEIAALDLRGISEAVYTIEVWNGAAPADLVWRESALASTRFGDGGGALSYVGPCDPSEGPNLVVVRLVELRDTTGTLLVDGVDFIDPSPVAREVTCVENADVPVTFNLVLLRSADQGFFDIAVSFADIFCSAKVDCQAELLHDLAPHGDGSRGPTAVMAFACASGENEETFMYLSRVEIECVDPTTAEVRRFTIPLGADGNGEASPADAGIYGTGLYSGQEAFNGIEKCYLDLAFGMDHATLGDDVCTVHAQATASPSALTGGATPADTVWPVIDFAAVISDGSGALCGPNPINGPGSEVRTRYTVGPTGLVEPVRFDWQYPCGEVIEPIGVLCAGAPPAFGSNVVFQSVGPDLVVLAVDGEPSPVYELPADAVLDGCCGDPCCSVPL